METETKVIVWGTNTKGQGQGKKLIGPKKHRSKEGYY
jgi:hypothetical protein